MDVRIKKEIKLALEKVRVGVLHFDSIVTSSSEMLWNKINALESKIISSLKIEEVNKIPGIKESRLAYKKLGKDPNRYRPSADSLNRRVVKGNSLYKVNNVVDCLNYISLKSGISIGGYDLSKIIGGIILDKGNETDEYRGIGRGELNIKDLPVLRDDMGVFGSPTSDSERTMINEQTKKIGFFFFDFGFDENLDLYIQETQQILEAFANGNNFKTTVFEF